MDSELEAAIIKLIDARIRAAIPVIVNAIMAQITPTIREMDRASDQVVQAMKDIAEDDTSEAWKRGQDDSDDE